MVANKIPPKRRCGPLPATEERYREALALYRSTTLSVKRICTLTHAKYSGFRTYLCKYHRELVLARHGIEAASSAVKLRNRRGQTPAAHAKYKDAIRACDDVAYIELNVSRIARLFHLDPTALSNQLHAHYPDILERREQVRRRLGVSDNQPRGVRPWCTERYAASVEMLRTSDKTIGEVADECGVSFSGLHEHLLFYHKDLVRLRADKRERAKSQRRRGALTGNGNRHEPSPEQVEKYRESVRLYKTTAMTQKQIVRTTGVSLGGFRNHLRTWYPELVFAHRGVEYKEESGLRLSQTKQYKKPTAAKYAAAIERLRAENRPTAEIAAEFGLHPECFRQYLKEHEPELYARQGMMRMENGRSISRRSMEKYAEAIRLYETTSEDLKSIARRLGIQYNSLGGFIRRNCPSLIRMHKQ
ncbi:MAG: hypothetical protein KHX48_01730 [Alistipes sp.]|nr:hypothetical protein [Alistipes sp.]